MRTMGKSIIMPVLCFLIQYLLQAQLPGCGIPHIINYSSEDYHSIDQNWTVLQDLRGVMCFGNTNGMLTFDGNNWQTHAPSRYNGVVRSLSMNRKGTIYTGSINSFGFLATDATGTIVFQPLHDQLPPARQSFNDIWKIACMDDLVFFMSRQSVFIFKNNKLINILEARKSFTYIASVLGNIYIHDDGSGLHLWNKGSLHPVAGGSSFRNQRLVFILPMDSGKLLAGTKRHGIFLLQNGKVQSWGPVISTKTNQETISCGIGLFDHSFAIGTFQSGVLFVNRRGQVTGSVSTPEGLISSGITDLFTDRDQNLWVTSTSGISFIEIHSPFRYYGGSYGLKRKIIMHSGLYRNRLYLAGTEAVYEMPYQEKQQVKEPQRFTTLEGSLGQSWEIETDDNRMYIAHNPGILLLENGGTRHHILRESNVYNLCSPSAAQDKLIATLDNGLVVVDKRDLSSRKILDLKDSPRYMELDSSGYLWVIPETLNGVYRVTFNQSYDSVRNCSYYNTFKGLPDQSVLSVVPAGPDVWVLTENGLYRYFPDSDRFGYDSLMNLFPVKGATLANSDPDGNLWFGGMNYLALLKRNGNNGFSPIESVFRRLSGHSIYHSAKLPDSTWILSGNSGIIQYNPRVPFTPAPFTSLITHVSSITRDTTKYHHGAFPHNSQSLGFSQGNDDIPDIPYRGNSLRFVFSSGCFIEPQKAVFRYSLGLVDDQDETWSEWSSNNVKEYTNLSEGSYVFRVVSKNVYGIESSEATYTFTILAPWYRTFWAYLLYLVLGVLLFYMAIRLNTRRLKLKNIHLEKIVKERTHEIQKQNEEIELQKGKIEEQHEKILLDRDHLEAMAIQLKELDEFKSRFFTNISHELKTPLTLIISPLEHLVEQAGDERVKQYYAIMLRNARRLLNLINQLLDLSKLERGMVMLNPEHAEINAFIRNVVDGFSHFAAEKKISLLFAEEGPALWLPFDKDILEKILNNLISNALKYTGEGGVITVGLSVADGDGWVSIMVKDSGEGIPNEHLERIFDRFYQAEGPDGRKKDGFGIGLSFVKELTEIHHGHISVKSGLAQGTEFTLLLPMKLPGDIPAQTLPQEKDPCSGSMAEPPLEANPPRPNSKYKTGLAETILVVEDNPDAMNFIAGNLAEQYHVLRAEDGAAGLAMAIETIPDLVVTDVMMPRMDGIEMTRRIRLDPHSCHIPVIMLTAKSSVESKIEGLKARADDYIAKPFNMKELQARIANLIAMRAELRRKYSDELNIKPAEVTTNAIDEAFLAKAIRLVEENMAREDFNIEHLYQELAMSRSLLHKKLKALTNQSASEFINDIRLRKAARMLKQRSASISEIAYKVGFNSISYFNTSFKRKFGMTPTEYMG